MTLSQHFENINPKPLKFKGHLFSYKTKKKKSVTLKKEKDKKCPIFPKNSYSSFTYS